MKRARQAGRAQARPRESDIHNAICAELIGSDTASAASITVTAYTSVLELCRRLLAAHDSVTPQYAYRGPILCLKVRSIAAWRSTATGPDLGAGASRTQPLPSRGSARPMSHMAAGRSCHERRPDDRGPAAGQMDNASQLVGAVTPARALIEKRRRRRQAAKAAMPVTLTTATNGPKRPKPTSGPPARIGAKPNER
jgi:hypothetical protein